MGLVDDFKVVLRQLIRRNNNREITPERHRQVEELMANGVVWNDVYQEDKQAIDGDIDTLMTFRGNVGDPDNLARLQDTILAYAPETFINTENKILVKNDGKIYELQSPVGVEFESDDFAAELANGDWEIVGGEEVPHATDTEAGINKIYDSLGDDIDGAATRRLVTSVNTTANTANTTANTALTTANTANTTANTANTTANTANTTANTALTRANQALLENANSNADVLVVGKNKFNKDIEIVFDSRIVSGTGVIQTNIGDPTAWVSTFLPLVGGAEYIVNSQGNSIIAEYDIDNVFIRTVTVNNTASWTTHVDTVRVRVHSFSDVNEFMIEEGDLVSDYEDYFFGVDPLFLDKAVLKADLGVTTDRIVVRRLGKNIFDNAASFEANTGYNSSGVKIAATGFNLYDYMEIEPSTIYVSNAAGNIRPIEFDENKKWLKTGTDVTGNTIFTTLASTKYVRFRISNSANITSLQVEKGTVQTTVVPWRLEANTPLSIQSARSISALRNNLALPAKQYLLTGTSNSLYFHGIMRNFNTNIFSMWMTIWKMFRNRATLTPTVSQTVTATLYDPDFEVMSERTFQTILGNPATNNGAIKLLTIGDSYGVPGQFQSRIASVCPNLTLLGTRRGHSQFPSTNVNEHYNGLSTSLFFHQTYTQTHIAFIQPSGSFNFFYGGTGTWITALAGATTGALYDTAVRIGFDATTGLKLNPVVGDCMYVTSASTFRSWDGTNWVNQTQSALGLQINMVKYRQAWQIDAPDIVTIMLGVNDFGGTFPHPKDFHTRYATYKLRIDQLITAIKADTPDAKIGIMMPTAYFPDHLDSDMGLQIRARNRQMFLQREQMIIDYDGREAENIYLVDVGSRIDPEFGFNAGTATTPFAEAAASGWTIPNRNVIGDPIHPEGGYSQIGTVYSAFIQSVR